jgi:hypothetical protein
MARKVAPLRFEEKVEREVKIFSEQSRARAQMAERAYNAQDVETREALDSMVDRIVSCSRGLISIRVDGQKVATSISASAIHDNALYLATEILKDLAILDIRVANYRFPQGVCAECKKEISPRKKRVRV